MTSAFLREYKRVINESISNDFTDNYDHVRFGPPNPEPARPHGYMVWSLKDLQGTVRSFLPRAGNAIRNTLQTGSPTLPEAVKAERWIKPNIAHFQWLYEHLDDEQSRTLLVAILAYRALGHRRIKLPLNTPEFWEAREEVKRSQKGAESMETGFRDWQVYRTDLRPFGYPFELFVRGIQTQFQLQQYRCALNGAAIEALPGDVVIDAGGCYGDTAFYFSHKVGSSGRVYSFEFLRENLAIFNRNLELNPDYAERIVVRKNPVWSGSGEELFVEGSGPATRVKTHSNVPSALSVKTLSIDDLVHQEKLARLDFIKMDIEGAELPALRGAEKSIRLFKPKLAISVYHQLRDFWEIPQWIESLNLGYSFHLRHFTIHQEETVLFAEAPR